MAESKVVSENEKRINQMFDEVLAWSPHPHPPRRRNEHHVVTSANSEFEYPDNDQVLLALHQGIENCKQIVREILPTCQFADQKTEVIERIKSVMKNMIRYEMKYIKSFEILEEAADEVADRGIPLAHTILSSSERFETITMKRLAIYEATLTDKVLEEQPAFQALLEEIEIDARQRDGHPADASPSRNASLRRDIHEEETLVYEPLEETFPTMDPITKLPLTDPVRNRICNHIYGKKAILEMIVKNSKFRCPTEGCCNRKSVRKSHLKQDTELTLRYKPKESERVVPVSSAQEHAEPETTATAEQLENQPPITKSKKRRMRRRNRQNDSSA